MVHATDLQYRVPQVATQEPSVVVSAVSSTTRYWVGSSYSNGLEARILVAHHIVGTQRGVHAPALPRRYRVRPQG